MRVSVSPIKGRLRIRWRYRGKDYNLFPGLEDTRQNKAYCEEIAAKIKADCLRGDFDTSLKRYKPWAIGHDYQCQRCPDLFERYLKAMVREKGLHGGSISRYKGCLSHIEKRLTIEAHNVTEDKARDFAAYLSEYVSNRTAKEYLWLIKACFEWAKDKYEVPEDNPWAIAISRVGSPKKHQKTPFNLEEIDSIIRTFQAHKSYAHYADFVAFLFGVGCRPGEAIAVQWKHINPRFETVLICQSYSEVGVKGTKTGETRTIQLSNSMQNLLRDRNQRIQPKPDDLIFPAKNGGYITQHNFRERAWKTILRDCGLSYRKPYITRHTAISLALEAGVDPVRIAEQTGHNLKTLLEHYAHVINRKNVFVEVPR